MYFIGVLINYFDNLLSLTYILKHHIYFFKQKNMFLIQKYFPQLSKEQLYKYSCLGELYENWNAQINVISRKDIEKLYLKHILHSLAIAKFHTFKDNSSVMDVGTGGGFPGIPLAIMFPNTHFLLVDSIAKKLKVVDDIVEKLNLKNVKTIHSRVENIEDKFDFVVSRAVTNMPDFVKLVSKNISKKSMHERNNGILYLKGGDLTDELKTYKTVEVFDLSNFFEEDFFETKKIVYKPIKP